MKTNKRTLLLASLILALLASVIGAYAYTSNQQEEKHADTTQSDNGPASDIKQNPPAPGSDSNPGPQITPSYSVEITEVKQEGGYVSVESVVDSDTEGTCAFSFTSEGARPITKTEPSTGSEGPQYCNLRAPEVEFEKIGSWSVTVRFNTGNSTAETTKNVEIR